MKNKLIVSLCATILLLLIYIGSCTHTGKSVPAVQCHDSIIETHTTDTLLVPGETVYYPVPNTVIDTFISSQNVDTLAVLAEYNKLKKYTLNVSDDTNSKISVYADVQYNRIISWKPDAVYYPHTKTVYKTSTITPTKRNKLLVGFILSGNKEYFGASPSLMIVTKKDNAFQVGYDVINGNYNFGYFVKLGKR